MRSLLTIMLLAAAMLPAFGHAQIFHICDITPQLREEIMRQLAAHGEEDCAAVDTSWLTAWICQTSS